ncbi:armadillo-type protein [Pholiota molesta]|nr:armadillo-type protein [Pholiota molesta]
MTVVSSDDETVFTSDGTDYERLTTHVLQKCHLQVTRGTALLRRPYHDLAATIEGAILDLLSEMKDKYQGVKVTAALLILIDELSKRSHLTTAIINTIPEILNARKEKGSEPQVSSTLASVSGEGSSQPYSAGTSGRGSFSSSTNFTPGKWGKNHYTANFARAELAISESSKTMGVIECLGSLKDEDASIREAAVSTIAQCSKQPSDITAIMEGIPDILNLLKDRDSGVRRAAVSTMTQFSTQPELVMAIEKCIPDILLFLKDENWRVREAAAGAIGEFSKQLDLVIAIESAMPILLTSLKQGNSDVRVAIISVIHALYKQCIISL